ncbi:Putative cutinase 1 [Verticillium dahliae VDG1]|nr:Putative cutinase 1 [Verticillium dahliae VDG1]
MAGDCTTDTCPVSQGFLNYRPTRPGNAVFLAAFALLVPVTLALGYRFKTPIFASILTTGLLLEVLGFAGRLLLFDNVANKTYFALFLLGTVLGSTFIAASIFIILPHALSVYGARASSVQPKHIALVLSAVALVAAIVEIIGTVCVGFAVLEAPQNANILVTGLAIQTAGLVVFVAVHSWFTINLNGERSRLDPKHATVYRSARFKRFLLVTQAATSEAACMVVNGALPFIVCALLAIFHPGVAFGKAWGPTSPRLRKRYTRPAPLRSPVATFEYSRSPDQTAFDKMTTPTSATMPLQNATMATTVKQNPVTQTTTQQPLSVGMTQKNSPTFWKEQQRRHSQRLSSTFLRQSPKTSPTFETNQMQQPRPSPTAQHGSRPHSQSLSGHRTSLKSEQAATRGKLVDSETLW